MKKEILVLMAFSICAALTFSPASARAEAVSTSQARIIWTSLTITGGITWQHKGSESYAYAEDDTGSDWASQGDDYWGWENPTSAFASVDSAYGDAYTDDDYLYEEVYAMVDEADSLWAYTEAYAKRWGHFVADSNGWVEFSVGYELSQDLGTDYADEWADGYAEAGLALFVFVSGQMQIFSSDAAWLENLVSDGESITCSDTGTLTVGAWFDAGEPASFRAVVYNGAEVESPEPATIALLGLGAFSLLRRKRR